MLIVEKWNLFTNFLLLKNLYFTKSVYNYPLKNESKGKVKLDIIRNTKKRLFSIM